MSNFNFDIKGINELEAKLKRVGVSLNKYTQAGASEAAKNLIEAEGLGKYPPLTAANQPPTPYYIRGRGMQYKTKNNYKSERLKEGFTVAKISYGAKIGNNASYAPYVVGEKQASRMAEIGWKSLPKYAKEKIDDIKDTLSKWIRKALDDAKLT